MSFSGRTILVTRPGSPGVDLAGEIERLEGCSVLSPAIRIDLDPDGEESVAARACMGESDRILFTSRNGVLGLLGDRRVDDIAGESPVAWTVGEATSLVARERGFEVGVSLSGGGLASLVQAILEDGNPDGLDILWPHGDLVDFDPLDPLLDAGAHLMPHRVYFTKNAYENAPPDPADVEKIDTVVFASPSAVHNLTGLLGVQSHWRVVAIGTTTADAVRDEGWQMPTIAEESSTAAIVGALQEDL